MIEIDGKIISTDILTEKFLCDLTCCRGMCCVEGNAGAPLEEEEVRILESEFKTYRDYLKPEGVEALRKQGFTVLDRDGEYTTPLIGGRECAFAIEEGGVTMCGLEKAWKDGRTGFRKPISCHLYPIRVARFSDGSMGLNYHRWSVCSAAVENGRLLGIPVYEALREPIIRAFGEEFFEALGEAAAYLEKNNLKGSI